VLLSHREKAHVVKSDASGETLFRAAAATQLKRKVGALALIALPIASETSLISAKRAV
jgi:hypothetical protein